MLLGDSRNKIEKRLQGKDSLLRLVSGATQHTR
uniref:Uncharacterized protein n=1 Tax=Anguilla anguilla TaxID=7936 RepID=A0A0E9SPN2_ANGAN